MDPASQTRSYARQYYEASKARPNYHIITGSTVTNLVFSGTTVTGVEVSSSPCSKFNFGNAHFIKVCHRPRAPCHQNICQKGGCDGSWNWPYAPDLAIVRNWPQAPSAKTRNQCGRRSSRCRKELPGSCSAICWSNLYETQAFFLSSHVLNLTFSVSNDYAVNPTRLTTDTAFAAEMLNLYETAREGKIARESSICFSRN